MKDFSIKPFPKRFSIKIDFDSHNFNRYLKHFDKMYRLISCNVKFKSAKVFKTKHGYHIYINQDKVLSKNEINILECLLYSDLFKQAFYYTEQEDILFKIKNGVAEKYSEKETKELNVLIKQINKLDYRLYKLEIPLKRRVNVF